MVENGIYNHMIIYHSPILNGLHVNELKILRNIFVIYYFP